MMLSINQPAYLPWLGYFHRIAVSDLHIVLDHVQFEKNSFTNRNKVKTAQGWCWLTVPVKTEGRFGNLPINGVEIDNRTNWRSKHWMTICQNYSKSDWFHEHAPFFESIYGCEWIYLADLCRETTDYLLHVLGISTPLQFSSQMKVQGDKDELLVHLCQSTGADIYLSGALGQNYIRPALFEQANIAVVYQNYHHPHYVQYRGGEFQPYLSIIDLLFNHGPESLNIMLAGQEPIPSL